LTQYQNNSFQNETLKASLKIKYKGKKSIPSINASLRIKKDEVIWMSLSKFISIGKLKITPNSVQFYNKLDHTYYDGDFTVLSDFLGTEINFKQVQNILLGEAIFDLNQEFYTINTESNNFLFSPKEQHQLYDLFFWLDANNYKLNKQEIRQEEKNKMLSVQYDAFEKVANIDFPKHIYVLSKDDKNTNTVDIDYSNVAFDMDLKFPFKIPNSYKEIKL
jgi:hypothetical protein